VNGGREKMREGITESRNISRSMNFQHYFLSFRSTRSFSSTVKFPGKGFREIFVWTESMRHRTIDFGKACDSNDPLLIGLWKYYDKNIVERMLVDYSHFYWQKFIDSAFNLSVISNKFCYFICFFTILKTISL